MRSGLRSASMGCCAASTDAAPTPHVSNARRFIRTRDQARRRSSPRLRAFSSGLEDVAVEDRRDTQVRHIDQLRDIEIDGHAYHRIGLFACQPLLLVALRAAILVNKGCVLALTDKASDAVDTLTS